MNKRKQNKYSMLTEGEKLLLAIQEIQTRLICARQGFEAATDEALVDSYIFEITALQKKYDFFLKTAKEMGLTMPFRKIG
ncbi:hypothetical protein CLNEO_04190 [Anaerotignum neopropionicum]|uniref:DUF2508 domain-containing protein n=1 Tax=Anaerotignum neopropionicum TaxID=36847 RepID=A0A136WIN0_9FIRM|nr:DUF2508 family protein [Anaerotignum neopropionicum]KXL54189.1 hypothetical protein CLNEO_02900 [Anaerotignum neopropionicum]KXL54314.1 hypothetical protein CLNEO_04190 [Anaerotignum neopropionicum]